MKPTTTTVAGFVSAAFGLLISAASLGQAQAPAPRLAQTPAPLPPVGERVEVNITNVEVMVTDSKGNRVTDLRK